MDRMAGLDAKDLALEDCTTKIVNYTLWLRKRPASPETHRWQDIVESDKSFDSTLFGPAAAAAAAASRQSAESASGPSGTSSNSASSSDSETSTEALRSPLRSPLPSGRRISSVHVARDDCDKKKLAKKVAPLMAKSMKFYRYKSASYRKCS